MNLKTSIFLIIVTGGCVIYIEDSRRLCKIPQSRRWVMGVTARLLSCNHLESAG